MYMCHIARGLNKSVGTLAYTQLIKKLIKHKQI